MDYPKTAMQQFGQAQAVPPTVYEAHQHAVNEWVEACTAFQSASARRASAEKQLEQTCQALHQHIEQTRNDPTCPPPPQPANGLSGINYNLGPR